MEILFKSKEDLSSREIYFLTRDPMSKSIQDLEDGEIITPKCYVVYREVDAKEVEREILSIMDENGSVVSTVSETFRKEFDFISDLMRDEPFSISKLSGKNKNDKTYVTCRLV